MSKPWDAAEPSTFGIHHLDAKHEFENINRSNGRPDVSHSCQAVRIPIICKESPPCRFSNIRTAEGRVYLVSNDFLSAKWSLQCFSQEPHPPYEGS
jgi:hypothetical protein